jgi:hypothetical protein
MENTENIKQWKSKKYNNDNNNNSVWDCLINRYIEIILDDGIDPTKPHIIKKTGLLIGADYNFVFIRGKIKIEALAIKNIERIAELEEQGDMMKAGVGVGGDNGR